MEEYNRKRKFSQTPEPPGKKSYGEGPLRFVVQLHQASRLHYDFRLEADGVLKSWAVPKGPSLDPQDQRLAVLVEDHPIEYGEFEGIIPKGNYGAGTVMLWDEGTYVERNSKDRKDSEKAILAGLAKGHITFIMDGSKLRGEFALIRLNKGDDKSWLLVKKRDEYSSRVDIRNEDASVKTGRTLEEIALQSPSRGDRWLPVRGAKGGESSGESLEETGKRKKSKAKVHPKDQESKKSLGRASKSEKFPRKIKPTLAIEEKDPFFEQGWLYEFEYGGKRTLAAVENGIVHLYSKQLLSFDRKFPKVVEKLRQVSHDLLLDGEIVEEGTSVIYWVRDILHLDGVNLRNSKLSDRKKKLKNLPIFDDVIRYLPHVAGEGKKVFEDAKEQGFPSVLVRDDSSLYKEGISKSWIRILINGQDAESQGPKLSHLDKIYWPDEGITKGNLIDYYQKIASSILPHLVDRPQSMHRHPNGIRDEGFFQKDLIGHYPKWIQTTRIFSESANRSIDYLLCQNEWTLLYMINLGCIELNPWLSKLQNLDCPDALVIDLDPDDQDFVEVVEVAVAVHELLESIDVFHLCKTSGATGLHFYIPTGGKYNYEFCRKFALTVCELIHKKFPKLTSLERVPSKRRGKIYLDCLQNARGQTVASPYSVRPRAGATVSTPLLWKELSPKLSPADFTIKNIPQRLKSIGDLWAPLLEEQVDLAQALKALNELPQK